MTTTNPKSTKANPTSTGHASANENGGVTPTQQPPIAVVGLGGLFPDSVDVARFWGHIVAKSDLITDIPEGHWRTSDYYDPDLSAPDKTYGQRGGFLPKVPFDTLGFGIPPNLLSQTDTSQLLALMVAQTTLEDAMGKSFTDVDAAAKQRISCILGVTSGQELFGQMASRLRRPQWRAGLIDAGLSAAEADAACDKISERFVPWTESTFPGLLGNVVAGRIANRLDLGGTNAVCDAACASSFAALSMGIDELVLGRADMVLTGGVDTLNDIFMFMCFSKTPALSQSGRVAPFDAGADGTLLGEGLSMLALKRLDDAERDGDKIYAVIRGVGTSSDGRSKSVYAPVSHGQKNALTRAYAAAGYTPRTVELVEGHGTGTKAGDVAEIGGLKLAFGPHQQTTSPEGQEQKEAAWCALGSVKSQIGHTKSAAGATGLTKVVLALHDKVLPPTINVDAPNPKADLDESPFYLSTEARPWLRDDAHPRRASVSSFGFGGSNFHVTVEEYRGSPDGAGATPPRMLHRNDELFVVTAQNAGALPAAVQTALSVVDDAMDPNAAMRPSHPLFFAAKTLAENAVVDAPVRVAFVSTSLAHAKKTLTALATKAATLRTDSDVNTLVVPGVHVGHGAPDGRVAFLCAGQGSQYVNMGADLALHFPAARAAFDQVAQVRYGTRQERVTSVMIPQPVHTDAQRTAQSQKLLATEWAQPALGALTLAHHAVLSSLGVSADAAAGHSYGELAALHLAGSYDAETLLDLSRARGEAMRDVAQAGGDTGSMRAVFAPRDDVARAIAGTGAVVANHNGPKQTVIAGRTGALEKADAALSAAGLKFQSIPVACAFHSEVVQGASVAVQHALHTLDVKAPRFDVYRNETATPYADASQIKAGLCTQLQREVRFVDLIERMYADGVRTFVELGPSGLCTKMATRILKDKPHRAIALDDKKRGDTGAMLNGIGAMVAAGLAPRIDTLFAHRYLSMQKAPRKTATLINGSNVGKPSLDVEEKPRASLSLSAPVASTPAARAPLASPPPAATSPVPTTPLSPERPPMSQPPVPAPLMGADASVLEVIRDGQRQALQAQQAFQQAMTDTHLKFLEAFERSSSQLAQVAGGVAPVSVAAPAVAAAAPLAAAAPVFVAPPAAAPTATPPAVHAAPVAAAPVAAAPIPAAVAPTVNMMDAFLDVIADKTGYPKEALEPGMNLEADLGIDSIKRVEILSAIKEAVPTVKDVDAMVLAQKNTIAEVAEALMPDGATVAPATTPAPVAIAASSVPTVSADGMMDAFLNVIADKTGYPKEALEPGMNLEADLGIDSIKRVEILSAIKEAVPTVKDVDAMVLAQKNTIAEVADALMPDDATHAAAAGAAASTASAVSADGMMDAFLNVIADKTGYPKEALEPGMNLEADLGIDSIKRVEILSAIKEAVPTVKDVDAMVLAQKNTIAEVADALMPEGSAPSASAASTASAVSADGMMDAFLNVIADKTGYPKEALEPGMNLEADLGIDSIKRVEILSAIKEAVPTVKDVDAMVLAQKNTIAEVADALMPDGETTTTIPTARPKDAPTPAAVPRFVGRFRNVESPPLGPVPAGVIAVAGGTLTLRDAVVLAIQAHGGKAHPMPLNGHTAACTAFIDLSATEPGSVAEARGAVSAAFATAQVFSQHRRPVERALFVYLGGGAFGVPTSSGLSDDEDRRAHSVRAGVGGLAKTYALEHPETSVTALDLAEASPDALAAHIVEEFFAATPAMEVARTATRRRIPTLATWEAPARTTTPARTWVVSGGARGVTAACVRALIDAQRDAGAPAMNLLLLGRTTPEDASDPSVSDAPDEAAVKAKLFAAATAAGKKPSPVALGRAARAVMARREMSANIEMMRQAGATVRYVAADAADRGAVQKAVDDFRNEAGPIEGLVHGAGVIIDKRIEEKTIEQWRTVFGTKVDGLLALLDATANDPITRVVNFGSAAGRFGNVGQADYAAANEVLTRLSYALATPERSLCTVAWGPWDGGMVDAGLKQLFLSRGVPVLPLDEGAAIFVEACLGDNIAPEWVVSRPLSGDSLGDGDPAPPQFALIRSVDVLAFPHLKDHAIDGHVVLPVVVAADLMAQAVAQRFGDAAAVKDLRVHKGIRLDGFAAGEVTRLRIEVQAQTGGRFDVTLRPESSERPHYAATVGTEVPLALEALPTADGLLPYADEAKVYSDILFHGPAFHLVKRVRGASGDGFSAVIKDAAAAGWGNPGQLDTAALDAALQVALLFGRARTGHDFLPTGIDRIVVVSEAPLGDNAQCDLVATSVHNDAIASDMVIRHASGAVHYRLEGVRIHRLQKKPGAHAAHASS